MKQIMNNKTIQIQCFIVPTNHIFNLIFQIFHTAIRKHNKNINNNFRTATLVFYFT